MLPSTALFGMRTLVLSNLHSPGSIIDSGPLILQWWHIEEVGPMRHSHDNPFSVSITSEEGGLVALSFRLPPPGLKSTRNSSALMFATASSPWWSNFGSTYCGSSSNRSPWQFKKSTRIFFLHTTMLLGTRISAAEGGWDTFLFDKWILLRASSSRTVRYRETSLSPVEETSLSYGGSIACLRHRLHAFGWQTSPTYYSSWGQSSPECFQKALCPQKPSPALPILPSASLLILQALNRWTSAALMIVTDSSRPSRVSTLPVA